MHTLAVSEMVSQVQKLSPSETQALRDPFFLFTQGEVSYLKWELLSRTVRMVLGLLHAGSFDRIALHVVLPGFSWATAVENCFLFCGSRC